MLLGTKLKHLSCIPIIRTFSHFSTPHHRQRHQPPPPQQDPYTLLKEDPIQVLSDLWVRTFSNQNRTHFSNLTGFLSKLDLWLLAYQRTCAHFTGSFPSRNAIQSHVLTDLLSLRNAVVQGQFQWNMKTHPYIQNPNDKTPFSKLSNRKLRTISNSDDSPFQDSVVQEVLLMILEPVFEPSFSSKSHAFRPQRNAHTVIRTIRSNFAGYVWLLRGDLTILFDNFDVDLMMGFVEKGAKDQKVLNLIKSGLKGLPKSVQPSNDQKFWRKKTKNLKRKKILDEDEAKPDPYWLRTFYDFAPEEAAKVPNYGYCGILSPLLANICLNELDHMMEEKILGFFRLSDDNSLMNNPSWPEFVRGGGKDKTKKMDYIRYGGHFLIGIRGPRSDAVEIRNDIIEFCASKYGLKLDESKVEIEHVTRGVQFLDHVISQRVIYPNIRFASNGGHIVTQKSVGVLLSVTASLQQCIRQFRRLKFVKGDKDPEPLPCSPMLYCGQAQTNSQMNKFLETMADWYQFADNRKKVVGFCAYVIRSSVAKLYAARYKMKSRAKVFKKASRDLSRPLRQSMDNRTPEYAELLRLGLADAIEGIRFSHMSMIPSCDYTPFPRNWIPDHERVLLDYIKLQDLKFFSQLQRSVKEQSLSLPQDMLGEIVWDYKTLGARNRGFRKGTKPNEPSTSYLKVGSRE
ncbi:nuclear intron maturase 1, mitochondrial [Cynara cardunculus var. scolymus]|uniref:nuclear intron maturase 1, mitochondrial n=1 Tax=Cynara cardunculus var. scolymus TaxID=59895 RepID=UPI000D630945|nr:nuclear intron maturase 1, mitochondrial [Cynara cardunculus var. scolymus]